MAWALLQQQEAFKAHVALDLATSRQVILAALMRANDRGKSGNYIQKEVEPSG